MYPFFMTWISGLELTSFTKFLSAVHSRYPIAEHVEERVTSFGQPQLLAVWDDGMRVEMLPDRCAILSYSDGFVEVEHRPSPSPSLGWPTIAHVIIPRHCDLEWGVKQLGRLDELVDKCAASESAHVGVTGFMYGRPVYLPFHVGPLYLQPFLRRQLHKPQPNSGSNTRWDGNPNPRLFSHADLKIYEPSELG